MISANCFSIEVAKIFLSAGKEIQSAILTFKLIVFIGCTFLLHFSLLFYIFN